MRFPSNRTWRAGALLGALGPATAAGAEPRPVTARLVLERAPGAETCVDSASLSAAVNQRWGRDVFVDSDDADIVLSARLAPRERGGFAATIDLSRRGGENLGTRELTTASKECSSLDDSLALAAGLMLDVSRRRIEEERRVEAEAAPRAAPPPPASETPIAIPEDTFAPRAKTRFETWAGVEALAGVFPGPATAVKGGVVVEPAHFSRIEVAGSWFLPADHDEAAGRGVHFSAWSAEVLLCPLAYRSARFGVHGCASERVGQVRASGFGFFTSERVTEPISSLGMGVGARFLVAPAFGLRLGLRAELPVVRYRFVFTEASGGTGVAHGMSAVAVGAEAGILFPW
ncbi:MAG TPA: hypothetical protein VHE30_00370 [Polyangiaceae bacterium]|nr:hypothetical protein [Polyangiaceae bacterium]